MWPRRLRPHIYTERCSPAFRIHGMTHTQSERESRHVILQIMGCGVFMGNWPRENWSIDIHTKSSKYGSISSPTGSYQHLLHAIWIWISKIGTLGSQSWKTDFEKFGDPNGRRNWFFTWDPNFSVFEIQICVAWRNGTIFPRFSEDTKILSAGRYPIKNPYPICEIPC